MGKSLKEIITDKIQTLSLTTHPDLYRKNLIELLNLLNEKSIEKELIVKEIENAIKSGEIDLKPTKKKKE